MVDLLFELQALCGIEAVLELGVSGLQQVGLVVQTPLGLLQLVQQLGPPPPALLQGRPQLSRGCGGPRGTLGGQA